MLMELPDRCPACGASGGLAFRKRQQEMGGWRPDVPWVTMTVYEEWACGACGHLCTVLVDEWREM